MSRITDVVKGVVELNLRYTSTLLHLSKDYIKDAAVVLTEPAPPSEPCDDEQRPPSRPPLLIVGRAGETGNAAFAITNPTDREMHIHLVVQGELSDRVVSVEPAELKLEPGKNAIVRLLARLSEELPVDRDHVGTVVAPGLAHQGVPFIVRRLADSSSSPPPAKPGRTSNGKH